MTRLGDFLHFGQPFKASGILPKLPTLLGNFCKGVKFLVKPFLGNFYRHLAIFIWSHWWCALKLNCKQMQAGKFLGLFFIDVYGVNA